jgi:inorganic triphosphatase YgiF
MPPTPMLDRMKAVRERSQAIGEFLERLQSRGYVLCRWAEGRQAEIPWLPAAESVEELLAEYFGIGPNAAERERQAVLEWLWQRG